MADLISRAAAKFKACNWSVKPNDVIYDVIKEAIKTQLDMAPAVDAVPVVHGRPVWINPLDPGAKICTWKCSSLCSVCRDYVAVGWNYCQSCGAKMDGEQEAGYEVD